MILVFALSPRCGSTAITEAISKSLITNWISEPFSSGWSSWASAQIHEKPNSQNIFRICEKNNIGVIKTIEYHLPREENIPLINRCKSIFLYRKSFVDMTLSEFMSFNYCEKTGEKYAYHIRDISKLNNFYTLKRNKIDIGYMLENFRYLKMLKKIYLKESNIDAVISYEDYFDDNVINNHYELIYKLGLTVSCSEFESILNKDKKHNSHKIYKNLIPNYTEVMEFQDKLIL